MKDMIGWYEWVIWMSDMNEWYEWMIWMNDHFPIKYIEWL